MAISYDIDSVLGIVTVKLSGAVTAPDFAAYFAATHADARFRPDMPRLVTATGVDSYPTSEELAEIAYRIHSRSAPDPAPFAVVVDNPMGVGMANMVFGRAGLGAHFQTFSDEAAAMHWLSSRSDTGDGLR